MKTKNTALFGASLIAALGAISVDHFTSEAPKPNMSQEIEVNPCAAAMPAPKAGQRNYDDIATDYSSDDIEPAPAPSRSAPPTTGNPCSAGSF